MILKYLTIKDKGTEKETAQWNYIDGVTEASTYVDKTNNVPCVLITRKGEDEMAIALHAVAYLLNDHGATIDKIRM